MELDRLLAMAEASGIPVEERPLKTYDGRIKNNKIYLRQNMTGVQKKCVLAEELGHYHTTVGEIIDQSSTANRKQEARARLWAYTHVLSLLDIVKAYKRGCHTLYDMAERLDVTEDFLQDALQRYRSKYGTHTTIANYTIYFEPALCVYELLHEETVEYTAVGNDDTTA